MNWKTARLSVIASISLLAIILLWFGRSHFIQSQSGVLVVVSPPPRQGLTPSGRPDPRTSHANDDIWANRWQQLSSAMHGAERDRLLVAFLEELATRDPQGAIAFALSEADTTLRDELLQATIRGWGTVAPDAALAWARSQTFLERGLASSAVFHGAVSAPERALKLVATLSVAEPEHAEEYSRYLVAAFGQSGKFLYAAAFASAAPKEYRTNLMMDAYARWTQTDPLAAIVSARNLIDADTQKDATSAVLSRWAIKDPAAATDYALELDSAVARKYALAVALPVWAEKDPAAARAWIGRFEPSLELDAGMAAVATAPTTLKQPDFAMIWAESIVATRLRIRTQATILNQWATSDPTAARRYADSIPDVSPEDRAVLFSAFKSSVDPVHVEP